MSADRDQWRDSPDEKDFLHLSMKPVQWSSFCTCRSEVGNEARQDPILHPSGNHSARESRLCATTERLIDR
jgi:hypothetical protein